MLTIFELIITLNAINFFFFFCVNLRQFLNSINITELLKWNIILLNYLTTNTEEKNLTNHFL